MFCVRNLRGERTAKARFICSITSERQSMEIEQNCCQICFDDENPESLLKFDCKACIWCADCTREWLSKQPRKGQLLKANFSCCNCRIWLRDTTGKIPRSEVDYIQKIFKHLSGLLIESRGEQEILSKSEVPSDFLDTYDFVICHSCESPYFGGLHACNEVKFNGMLKIICTCLRSTYMQMRWVPLDSVHLACLVLMFNLANYMVHILSPTNVIIVVP